MGPAFTQEEAEAWEKEEELKWRYVERDIDGGFCGCEYPRLWPPRRAMTGKHALRPVKRRGKDMLRCKRCHLLCPPNMQAQMMATKCPGRKR